MVNDSQMIAITRRDALATVFRLATLPPDGGIQNKGHIMFVLPSLESKKSSIPFPLLTAVYWQRMFLMSSMYLGSERIKEPIRHRSQKKRRLRRRQGIGI